MPQSKSNTNMSISRDVHASLVEILIEKQKEVKKQSGLDVTYSLNDVVKMLVNVYRKSR